MTYRVLIHVTLAFLNCILITIEIFIDLLYSVKASDYVMHRDCTYTVSSSQFITVLSRKRVIALGSSVADLSPGDNPCARKTVESELPHYPYSFGSKIPKLQPGSPNRHPVARIEED